MMRRNFGFKVLYGAVFSLSLTFSAIWMGLLSWRYSWSISHLEAPQKHLKPIVGTPIIPSHDPQSAASRSARDYEYEDEVGKDKERINIFYMQPKHKLINATSLLLNFNILIFFPPQDIPLINFFNPARHPYPHLFTGVDSVAETLARNASDMGDLTTCSSLQLVQLLRNKLRFNEFLQNHGFGNFSPKSYQLKEDVREFPVILKPQEEAGSSRVMVAHNEEELSRHIERMFASRLYLIQEYIENQLERTAHFVALKGRIIKLVCHERSLKGRKIIISTPNLKTYPGPQLEPGACFKPLFTSIVEKLNYTGAGNIDFRLSKQGVPKLLEFNPRLSGTVLANATLLAEFLCAFQFNGLGVPTKHGCARSNQ